MVNRRTSNLIDPSWDDFKKIKRQEKIDPQNKILGEKIEKDCSDITPVYVQETTGRGKETLTHARPDISRTGYGSSQPLTDTIKQINSTVKDKSLSITQIFKNQLMNSPLIASIKKIGKGIGVPEKKKLEVGSDFNKDICDQVINKAWTAAPGNQNYDMSDPKVVAKLADEWLTKDPLTGICTGLAVEFILNREKDPEHAEMKPTPTARYFEKVLIPVIVEVMKEKGISDHTKVGKECFDPVYDKVATRICEDTGLEVERLKDLQHFDLKKLNKELDIGALRGHQLLILEDPNGRVAANHTIYFDAEKGIIGDGAVGAVVKVPENVNFNDFLKHYLNEKYGESFFTHASVISVTAPAGTPLRTPSLAKRARLNFTLCLYRVANSVSSIFSFKK